MTTPALFLMNLFLVQVDTKKYLNNIKQTLKLNVLKPKK